MFSKTLPFLLEFSAIVFSTILAIMIEIKLFRWSFLLYNYLLFELELEIHQDFVCLLILLLVFVSWILGRALWHFHYKKNPIPQRIVHGTTIEILRTIFPSIIPMFIAIPSFALLYSMDEVVVDPAITIKAIGHQWYRSAPLHEGD